MKKRTYRLEGEDEILVSEEISDDDGQVLSLEEYNNGITESIITEYNSENWVVRISHFEDETPLNIVEYEYNETGEVIEQRLLIGEEIYEVIQTELYPDGFVRITIQDGEEIEKLIHKGDDTDFKSELYKYGELIEYQISKKNKRENEISVTYFDPSNTQIATEINSYDSSDRQISRREVNGKEQVLCEEEFKYSGNLVIENRIQDFTDEYQSAITTYAYDRDHRLLKLEKKTLAGKLVEFQQFAYDNRGKCIEEVFVQTGKADAISGSGQMGIRTHLLHRYE